MERIWSGEHSSSDAKCPENGTPNPSTDTKQQGNVVTICGKRYRQTNERVVAVPAPLVELNENEFRFYVYHIARRGRQIGSLLSLGTFLCFLAAYFGLIDTRPSDGWTFFVFTLFALGILAELSVFTLNGCRIPDEQIINKCLTDTVFLMIFIFVFTYSL